MQEARTANFIPGIIADGDRAQNEVSKFNNDISDYRDKVKQAFGDMLIERKIDFQDVKQLDKVNAFRVNAPGDERTEPNGHDLLQIDHQKVRENVRAFVEAKKDLDTQGDRIARANAVQQEVIKAILQPLPLDPWVARWVRRRPPLPRRASSEEAWWSAPAPPRRPIGWSAAA